MIVEQQRQSSQGSVADTNMQVCSAVSVAGAGA